MKHRDFYLDNICGILILYMIFILHCGDLAKSHSVLSSLLGKLLFSFMMPWFFFKSGMFADKAKFDIKKYNFPKRYENDWRIPNRYVYIYMFEEEPIWGMTAEIICDFIKILKKEGKVGFYEYK